MARTRQTTKGTNKGANLGFEEKLWQAADKMRGHMDPAEYKHVALGLIFLKYISDAFEQRRAELAKEQGADPEDRDEYLAENVFWVPKQARWKNLQANAKQPTIGKLLDDAMVAIEKENPSLKGVLPKDYARPTLDKYRLGELIDLIGSISFQPSPGLRPPSPSGRGAGGEGNPGMAGYADVPGFCKSATLEEIRKHGHVLTPGRYVGAEAVEDDGEPFEEKMKRLSAKLEEQFAESTKLEQVIREHLRKLR